MASWRRCRPHRWASRGWRCSRPGWSKARGGRRPHRSLTGRRWLRRSIWSAECRSARLWTQRCKQSSSSVALWGGDAPAKIATAYRNAEQRTPIAVAVAERFGDELAAPLDRTAQQWWTDGSPWFASLASLFRGLDRVTVPVSSPGRDCGPRRTRPRRRSCRWSGHGRWKPGRSRGGGSPCARTRCLFEVHRPTDWARLVAAHPRRAAPHPGWELPGVNQHVHEIDPLLGIAGQRVPCPSVGRHLVPDWQSVATQYDGIHLSWAGFITTEGCIVDLGGGDVTMLRYWFSERALWLADVFGIFTSRPRPADQPRGRWLPLPTASAAHRDHARVHPRPSRTLRTIHRSGRLARVSVPATAPVAPLGSAARREAGRRRFGLRHATHRTARAIGVVRCGRSSSSGPVGRCRPRSALAFRPPGGRAGHST